MRPGGCHSSSLTRAWETPDPPNQATLRALNALRAGRFAEAGKWALQIPVGSPFEQAWRFYADVRILLEQGDFASAMAMAQRSASAALLVGLSDPPDVAALRLSAAALELKGAAHRRQDQPVEAGRIHLAALALRREHGTPAEQCESAASLGFCAQWSGDVAAAERWYQAAANFAGESAAGVRQKSWAQIQLSGLLSRLSRHEEAVEAARCAQHVLSEHLPGEMVTIAVGLHLAQAIIAYAETLLGENSDRARSLLADISPMLLTTRENLLAFGPDIQEELAWCDQLLDFTERLRLTL